VQKSNFFSIIILISFIFASNSQSTWNGPAITCTDPSGVNVFNPQSANPQVASGAQTFYSATKVLQTVDSNIEVHVKDPITA
jgi:nitrogen fixation protein FixH